MRAWLFLLIACVAVEEQPVGSTRVEFEDVSLTVGEGVTATLSSAYLDPDGQSGGGEQVVATVEGTEPLVITGERSTWDLAEGTVVFEGQVVAVRGSVELRCETLTGHINGERIERVEAVGGVRVTRGDRTVTAARGRLQVDTGALTLTGSPVVTEGERRLSGQRVVIYLDDERLVCDGCRLEVPGTWLDK